MNNAKAKAAYLAKLAAAKEELEALTAAIANMEAGAEDASWASVSDVACAVENMTNINDRLLGRGEYAPNA